MGDSYLWGLSPDLTSTSQRSVNLSSLQGDGQVNGVVLQDSQVDIILERSAGAEKVQLLAVDTFQHGELGPQTGYISLWRHVQHVGLVSVHNQLHRDDKLLK